LTGFLENEHIEFKRCGTANFNTLTSDCLRYAVGYLNAGIKGHIFFGICDDKTIEGMPIDSSMPLNAVMDVLQKKFESECLPRLATPVVEDFYQFDIQIVSNVPDNSTRVVVIFSITKLLQSPTYIWAIKDRDKETGEYALLKKKGILKMMSPTDVALLVFKRTHASSSRKPARPPNADADDDGGDVDSDSDDTPGPSVPSWRGLLPQGNVLSLDAADSRRSGPRRTPPPSNGVTAVNNPTAVDFSSNCALPSVFPDANARDSVGKVWDYVPPPSAQAPFTQGAWERKASDSGLVKSALSDHGSFVANTATAANVYSALNSSSNNMNMVSYSNATSSLVSPPSSRKPVTLIDTKIYQRYEPSVEEFVPSQSLSTPTSFTDYHEAFERPVGLNGQSSKSFENLKAQYQQALSGNPYQVPLLPPHHGQDSNSDSMFQPSSLYSSVPRIDRSSSPSDSSLSATTINVASSKMTKENVVRVLRQHRKPLLVREIVLHILGKDPAKEKADATDVQAVKKIVYNTKGTFYMIINRIVLVKWSVMYEAIASL
jgi:hypothetical protein